MSRPYVGILISGSVYNGIPRRRTGFERLSFYEEAGRKFNFIPCFFRLKDIKLDQDLIQVYVKDENNNYTKQLITLPKVIHNRGLSLTKMENRKIQYLIDRGTIIFNNKNRYGKYKVHEVLSNNKELCSHLPVTYKANEETIYQMLEKYDSLIIKPSSGSLGSGVMLIEKKTDRNVWTYRNKRTNKWNSISFTNQLPENLKTLFSKRTFIVQQRIPLACYQGNPFDLRVSVQKNETGKWQVTGIVGKVAKSGNFVTNVARGGSVSTLEVLLRGKKLDVNIVSDRIKEFVIKAATYLESEFDGLADLGFDIGITEEGFPMFIEINGRDLRITFRNAKMKKTWKATHITPLSYARYLLDTMEDV